MNHVVWYEVKSRGRPDLKTRVLINKNKKSYNQRALPRLCGIVKLVVAGVNGASLLCVLCRISFILRIAGLYYKLGVCAGVCESVGCWLGLGRGLCFFSRDVKWAVII